jgi:hypothetical protein
MRQSQKGLTLYTQNYFKETIESITTPVAKIFKKSMEDSKLPHRGKSANIHVTPIHKKVQNIQYQITDQSV